MQGQGSGRQAGAQDGCPVSRQSIMVLWPLLGRWPMDTEVFVSAWGSGERLWLDLGMWEPAEQRRVEGRPEHQ